MATGEARRISGGTIAAAARPWGRAAGLLTFSCVVLVGALRRLEPDTILVRAASAALIVAVTVRLARELTRIGAPQGIRRR